MIVERIYYPVTTLGYGKRVGIWVAGCEKNCKNCMSETLKASNAGIFMSVDDICKTVRRAGEHIDGITISGGEPFLQIEELTALTERLSEEFTDDIIIFTGYTLEQLDKKHTEYLRRIINSVSVIIDGEYVEALNDGVGIRGSSNQRVHIFKNAERHECLNYQKRSVQIIEHRKGMTVIGIP